MIVHLFADSLVHIVRLIPNGNSTRRTYLYIGLASLGGISRRNCTNNHFLIFSFPELRTALAALVRPSRNKHAKSFHTPILLTLTSKLFYIFFFIVMTL